MQSSQHRGSPNRQCKYLAYWNDFDLANSRATSCFKFKRLRVAGTSQGSDQRKEVPRLPEFTVLKASGFSHFSARAKSQHKGGDKTSLHPFAWELTGYSHQQDLNIDLEDCDSQINDSRCTYQDRF